MTLTYSIYACALDFSPAALQIDSPAFSVAPLHKSCGRDLAKAGKSPPPFSRQNIFDVVRKTTNRL